MPKHPIKLLCYFNRVDDTVPQSGWLKQQFIFLQLWRLEVQDLAWVGCFLWGLLGLQKAVSGCPDLAFSLRTHLCLLGPLRLAPNPHELI